MSTRITRAARAATIVSFLALCLVVGLVGVVATYASLTDEWIWLLRTERLAATAGPIALGLAAAAVITGIATVATTD